MEDPEILKHSPEIKDLFSKKIEHKKYIRKKNPIEPLKIPCSFYNCHIPAYCFFHGHSFCRTHNQKLRELLAELIKFKIRLK